MSTTRTMTGRVLSFAITSLGTFSNLRMREVALKRRLVSSCVFMRLCIALRFHNGPTNWNDADAGALRDRTLRSCRMPESGERSRTGLLDEINAIVLRTREKCVASDTSIAVS